jgi:hypothetical protein
MTQLLELVPGGHAGVALKYVVLLLCGTDEMERGEPHLIGLAGELGAEEALTAVDPTQGVLLALIGRE